MKCKHTGRKIQSPLDFMRVWAMPNAETFSIPPIREFVLGYIKNSKVSVDPFARNNQWATWTNDLNSATKAEYHLECEDFLKVLVEKGIRADLIIMDPPYSPRQVKECYDGIGIKMAQSDAMGGATKKRRRTLILKHDDPWALVLSFGWNTNGMGKEWIIEEIMLVAHGSDHNDTICMAERMQAKQLEFGSR